LSHLKGFCAEDLNVTECEGEGATEFVDVEGGGFDEGTGTTNVSKDCQDLKDQVTSCLVVVLFLFLFVDSIMLYIENDD